MNNFTGIILAGGQSKRIGNDKALISYKGKPLIEYSIDLLKQYCSTLLISANGPHLDHYGYTVVKDDYPKIGPIGGLYSTLLFSNTDHNLVCPCDMPQISPEIIKQILTESKNHSVVVVQEKNGKVNPLLAYYHRTSINGLKAQIDKGDFMMQEAVEQLKAKKLLIDDHHSLLNINYLKDME